jgi:hypothetical protein
MWSRFRASWTHWRSDTPAIGYDIAAWYRTGCAGASDRDPARRDGTDKPWYQPDHIRCVADGAFDQQRVNLFRFRQLDSTSLARFVECDAERADADDVRNAGINHSNGANDL